MTIAVEDWVWMLAFFPLWAVMAGIWFGFASAPKRVVGPRTRTLLNSTAVALSLCSAMGVLVGLNCGSFINLPFADPACHEANVQLSAWVAR
jgi:hypothetical protein